jgi:hypothetical protein
MPVPRTATCSDHSQIRGQIPSPVRPTHGHRRYFVRLRPRCLSQFARLPDQPTIVLWPIRRSGWEHCGVHRRPRPHDSGGPNVRDQSIASFWPRADYFSGTTFPVFPRERTSSPLVGMSRRCANSGSGQTRWQLLEGSRPLFRRSNVMELSRPLRTRAAFAN